MKKLKFAFIALICVLFNVRSYHAAAVTSLGATWNTTAGNKVVNATPAVGDLIVVIHGISDWASSDDSTITDAQGGTYTKYGTATAPLSNGGGTACALFISVRNTLIGTAAATDFTATNTGDTGGGLSVFKITGMTRTGAAAVIQTIGESTQTENPPSITFATATKTQSAIILGVCGEDNPAGATAPSGFTQVTNTGWDTPTTGIQTSRVDSGQTSAGYTWTGGALTDHNEVGIEIDASVRYRDCPLLGACE